MSQSNDTHEALIQILREYGELSGEIPPDKDLHTELGVKSVNFISILVAMEEKFEISIDDNQFTQARTLSALTDLVASVRS